MPTTEPVDTASLSAPLAQAADVDRGRCTDDSLAALDHAVAVAVAVGVGEIVLAGSTATAKDAKHATKLVPIVNESRGSRRGAAPTASGT